MQANMNIDAMLKIATLQAQIATIRKEAALTEYVEAQQAVAKEASLQDLMKTAGLTQPSGIDQEVVETAALLKQAGITGDVGKRILEALIASKNAIAKPLSAFLQPTAMGMRIGTNPGYKKIIAEKAMAEAAASAAQNKVLTRNLALAAGLPVAAAAGYGAADGFEEAPWYEGLLG